MTQDLTQRTQEPTLMSITYSTFWATTSDCIRLRYKTLQTSTDRISQFIGHTHSARSTRARITRIRFQDTPEIKEINTLLKAGTMKNNYSVVTLESIVIYY